MIISCSFSIYLPDLVHNSCYDNHACIAKHTNNNRSNRYLPQKVKEISSTVCNADARGHTYSMHAARGGGGVSKLRANACRGEGGSWP